MPKHFELPEHYQGRIAPEFEQKYIRSLERYFNDGIETGGFLRAVLENDLVGALKKADEYSRLSLPLLIDILLEAAPSGGWGSKGSVTYWLYAKTGEIAGLPLGGSPGANGSC